MIDLILIGQSFQTAPTSDILAFLFKMDTGELCLDDIPTELLELELFDIHESAAYPRYAVFIRIELLKILRERVIASPDAKA